MKQNFVNPPKFYVIKLKGVNSRRGFSPIAILLAVAVLIVGGIALFISKTSPNGEGVQKQGGAMMEEDEMMIGADKGMMDGNGNNMMSNQGGTMGGNSMMDASGAETFVFPVTAKNYSFGPAEIKVKKGSKARIELRVEEGFHDWVLDEFGAHTAQAGSTGSPQAAAGNTVTAEFVANRAGLFEYYCSVGSHRKLGMIGKFIVE